MEQLPATIHTFGFGYSLRSGLLKSIAEIGGGTYSFIPDAGMIVRAVDSLHQGNSKLTMYSQQGTVFVHAVANLQATYANKATLKLTYPSYIQLEETTGESVETQEPQQFDEDSDFERQLSIPLGDLRYGQPRDIYLKYKPSEEYLGALKLALNGEQPPQPPVVYATLEYNLLKPTVEKAVSVCSIMDGTSMPPAEIAYHKSRSAILTFLSSLYPLRETDGEHVPLSSVGPEKLNELEALIKTIPAADPSVSRDPRNVSLMEDLHGTDPKGQISMACKPEYFSKWGCHYLPSLAGAHSRQMCNSFKDPGPLMYGADSPLFIKCRDRLDNAFDSIEAPKPSNYTTYTGPIHMSMYNSSSNPCFSGCTRVALAGPVDDVSRAETKDGNTVRVGQLRAGMRVQTPKGPRRVVAVLKTRVRAENMCQIGSLLVTPWHPIKRADDQPAWTFPEHVRHRRVRYTGSIYSVLLERDSDPDAHAVMVGGVWGVTLGHGMTRRGSDTDTVQDVRAHPFLGDYNLVLKSLASLHRGRNGLVVGGGVARDPATGLMSGFKRVTPFSRRANTLPPIKVALAA
jgi:hypothetical protein